MTSDARGPRPIDHLVLPVEDLIRARHRLVEIGFTVAADALHPFGTENSCVFFADGTYLEPLAVASREDCEAAARAGNVFVARDQAFRFRCGQEGFSAVVAGTTDARADHARYRAEGFSAGDVLAFSRPMRGADGSETKGTFELAFAADLRAPDFVLFSCQRLIPLQVDKAALTSHANGVVGLSSVVLSEANPSDFQYLLEVVFEQRDVKAHSFGIELVTANGSIEVLTPEGLSGFYGVETPSVGRGLRGAAVSLRVADRSVTEKLLADNGIAFKHVGNRIVVPPAPGQGVAFAFEETA